MKCNFCGCSTIGDNFICEDCRENRNSYDEPEFNRCDKCDGHDACEDFGCAIEAGLGRMVKKNLPPGVDDWS